MSTEKREAMVSAVNEIKKQLEDAKISAPPELTEIETLLKGPQAFPGDKSPADIRKEFKAKVKKLTAALDDKKATPGLSNAIKNLEDSYNAFLASRLSEMNRSEWARMKLLNFFQLENYGNKVTHDDSVGLAKGETQSQDLLEYISSQPGQRIWTKEFEERTGTFRGRVYIEANVENQPDGSRKISLKSNNLDALATAAKASGAKTFTFESGTPDNALRGMREMLRVGITPSVSDKLKDRLMLSGSKSYWQTSELLNSTKLNRKREYEQLERIATAQQQALENATPDQLKQWNELRGKPGELQPEDYGKGTVLNDILNNLSEEDQKEFLEIIGKKPNLEAVERLSGIPLQTWRALATEQLKKIAAADFPNCSREEQKAFLKNKVITPYAKAKALDELAKLPDKSMLQSQIKNLSKRDMREILIAMKNISSFPKDTLLEIQKIAKASNNRDLVKQVTKVMNDHTRDYFAKTELNDQKAYLKDKNVSREDKAQAIVNLVKSVNAESTAEQREAMKETLKELMRDVSPGAQEIISTLENSKYPESTETIDQIREAAGVHERPAARPD